MSVSGLCGICGTERADRQCQLCGTFVCDEHYREGQGVCVQCAPDEGGNRFRM